MRGEAAERSTQDIADRLRSVLSSHPEVLEAYLFGSHARGTAQRHSDIDVAVYVQDPIPDVPYGYDAALAAELMAALGDDRVDLVLLNRAPPLLYHRVLRNGTRLLSRDLKATTVRESQARSRFCDFRPQLDKIERARRGRTASTSCPGPAR